MSKTKKATKKVILISVLFCLMLSFVSAQTGKEISNPFFSSTEDCMDELLGIGMMKAKLGCYMEYKTSTGESFRLESKGRNGLLYEDDGRIRLAGRNNEATVNAEKEASIKQILPQELEEIAPKIKGKWDLKVEDYDIILTANEENNIFNGQRVPKGTKIKYNLKTGAYSGSYGRIESGATKVRVTSNTKDPTPIAFNGIKFTVPEGEEMLWEQDPTDKLPIITCSSRCSIGEMAGSEVKTVQGYNTKIKLNKEGTSFTIEDGGIVLGGKTVQNDNGEIEHIGGNQISGKGVLVAPLEDLSGYKEYSGHKVGVDRDKETIHFYVKGRFDKKEENLDISVPNGLVYRFNEKGYINSIIKVTQPDNNPPNEPSVIHSEWKGFTGSSKYEFRNNNAQSEIIRDKKDLTTIKKSDLLTTEGHVYNEIRTKLQREAPILKDIVKNRELWTSEVDDFNNNLEAGNVRSFLINQGINDPKAKIKSVITADYIWPGSVETAAVIGTVEDSQGNIVSTGSFSPIITGDSPWSFVASKFGNEIEKRTKTQYLNEALLNQKMLEGGEMPQGVESEITGIKKWITNNIGINSHKESRGNTEIWRSNPLYFIEKNYIINGEKKKTIILFVQSKSGQINPENRKEVSPRLSKIVLKALGIN